MHAMHAAITAFTAAVISTSPELVAAGASASEALNLESCSLPTGGLSSWYFNTFAVGPYRCSLQESSTPWTMLNSYRDGTNAVEGVHWKYTDEGEEGCLSGWDYYEADGVTLVTSVKLKSTTAKSPKPWCALPVYLDGGRKGYQWEYCDCPASASASGSASSSSTDPTDSSSAANGSSSSTPEPSTPMPSSVSPGNDTSTSTDPASSSSAGLFIGIAVGCVVVVGLLVAVYMCGRRKRSAKSLNATNTGLANTVDDGYYFSPADHTIGLSADRRNSAIDTRDTSSGLWNNREIQNARIQLVDIRIGKELSRGGFGVVYLGIYKDQSVAVKRLLPSRSQDIKEVETFLSEAKLLSNMKHDRIIRLIGVAWNTASDLTIVTEFMEGGDLREMLVRYNSSKEPRGFTASKLKIAMHIVEALTYLHGFDPTVVHRDLKSKNVLLSSSMDAKLTDFGVSRERNDEMTAGVGSWLWMAPEVLCSHSYNEKADIFSFGAVLSELDTHQLPYAHARDIVHVALLHSVINGSLQVAFSEDADPDVVELARQCMSLNPQERPTAKKVLHQLCVIMDKYGASNRNVETFQF